MPEDSNMYYQVQVYDSNEVFHAEEEDEAGKFSCLPIETDSNVIDIAAGEDFFMFINENKVRNIRPSISSIVFKDHVAGLVMTQWSVIYNLIL